MKNVKLFEEFFFEPAADFGEVAGWMQEIYEWDYVEQEGENRIRFDWKNGQLSFWLNSDMTGEGNLPSSVKKQVLAKGVKIPVNEGMEKRGPVGYSEKEKQGKFVVSILTQEAVDRFERKYPDKPKSIRHMAYHFSPIPYEDAIKSKKEWETKGEYKGEKIKSVTLFRQSDIEQGD